MTPPLRAGSDRRARLGDLDARRLAAGGAVTAAEHRRRRRPGVLAEHPEFTDEDTTSPVLAAMVVWSVGVGLVLIAAVAGWWVFR